MDHQTLKKLLRYEPDIGQFYWVSGRQGTNLHKPAGYKNSKGYIKVKIGGMSYPGHRLAWLYMTGEWPKADIDHINGLKNDNRFCNLREATRAENIRNTGKRISNTSGFKGVVRWHRDGRWVARIIVDGKNKYLGLFNTPEEAHAAYADAATKYHGAFAKF